MSQAFIERLWKLERADLAELRRSLAFDVGTHAPAFRVIEPFTLKAQNWERNMHYLVGGLFALIERPTGIVKTLEPKSIGLSIAKLFVDRGKTPSVEARFIALLDADAEQLPYRLRQMIALLRDSNPIDWKTLLDELRLWNLEDKRIQRRWAQAFYRNINPVETEPETTNSTPEEETK